MGKRDWKKISRRRDGEDIEPTEYTSTCECDCS